MKAYLTKNQKITWLFLKCDKLKVNMVKEKNSFTISKTKKGTEEARAVEMEYSELKDFETVEQLQDWWDNEIKWVAKGINVGDKPIESVFKEEEETKVKQPTTRRGKK